MVALAFFLFLASWVISWASVQAAAFFGIVVNECLENIRNALLGLRFEGFFGIVV